MKDQSAAEQNHQGYEFKEKVFQSQLEQIGLMSMNLHGGTPETDEVGHPSHKESYVLKEVVNTPQNYQ